MSTRDQWMEINNAFKQSDSGNKVGHNFRLLADSINGRSRHHGSILELNQQCGSLLIMNLLDQKWAEDCIINFDYRYAIQDEELTHVRIREVETDIPTFTDSNKRLADIDNDQGNGTIVVTVDIHTDTPATGTVYIGATDSYEYSSWSSKTYTLSGTLTRDYDEESPVYMVTHGMVTIPAGTRGYCQVLFNDSKLIHDIKNLVVSSDSNTRYADIGNDITDTDIVVKTIIAAGTPQTGTVYIGTRSAHSENDSYEYTSWKDMTYQLSGSLSQSYSEDTPVYTVVNDKLQDIKIYCLGDNGVKILYGFNNEVVREITEILQKAFLLSPPECPLCEGTGEYPEGVECPDCNGYKFRGNTDITNYNWLYKQKAAEVDVYPLDNEGDSFQWLAWAKKWWITPTKDRIKEYISHFLRIDADKITIDEHYGYEDDQGVFHWREVYWVVRIPITSGGDNIVGDIVPTDDFTLQSLIYNVTPAGVSVVILEYSEIYEGEYDDYCDDYQTPAAYTLSGLHSIGATTITVTTAIDVNTPINSSIVVNTGSTDYEYRYSHWSGSVFYLTAPTTAIAHDNPDVVTVGEWTICPKQINHGIIQPIEIDSWGYGTYGVRYTDRYPTSAYFDTSPLPNFEEYVGSGTATQSTITVTTAITDITRSNGKITIYDVTNTEELYYSSWTGSVFTLESALVNTYSGATVYVGRHELADDPVTYTDSNGTGDGYIRVKGVMDSPAPPAAGWIVIGSNRYEYDTVATGTSPDYTKFTLVGTLGEDHSEDENVYIDHFYDDSLSASISHDDYIEKYLLRDQPWIYLEE